jgi:hypothetical protein
VADAPDAALAGYDNAVALLFVTVAAGPPCPALVCEFGGAVWHDGPHVTTSLFVLVRDAGTDSFGLVQRSLITNMIVPFND